jgi:UDP-N-acetyl-D-mannosaminuronate dehydrogenase
MGDPQGRLTHVDEHGAARMVDVGDKPVTTRTASATGRVLVSPAVIELLRGEGADVSYSDPHVPELGEFGLRSTPLTAEALAAADCVAIVTAHSAFDYEQIVASAPLVVDFRNATRGAGAADGKVVKL